ncbi:protein CLAVATA 3 [Lotus japonicus]|uniref:protein CLAVATA 3 n=1 Tax=Lotus japonicus TaxID=34305 RepID=UPI00258DB247|nr:protein CLAVATA 3 [Lotus japonicus]
MASKSIVTIVILLLLFMCLSLIMRDPSDCNAAYGCSAASTKKILNRKVLSVLKDKKTTLKARVLQGSPNSKYIAEKSLSWQLRKVPSGPDPLHHHGGSPKPETP